MLEVSSYINSTYGIFHKEGGRIPFNIYCYYMDEEEGGYYDDDGFPEYERNCEIRSSEEYEEMSKHLGHLFTKTLCGHASKVVRSVSKVWMLMCTDLLLSSPMEETDVEKLKRRFEQKFGKCIVMRIMYQHVPFDETIEFIRCIQPRMTKQPALADALKGVFEEFFLSTLLSMFVV